jgi:uncharacterized membrane protein
MVANTLLMLAIGSPKAVCTFSSMSQHIFGHFLKATCLCLLGLQIKATIEKIKVKDAQFNHTIFILDLVQQLLRTNILDMFIFENRYQSQALLLKKYQLKRTS